MGEAGVNVVSLAIFSWDKIEPVEGAFTFEWLDHVIDRLGRAGIAVDLVLRHSRRAAVAVRIPSRGAAGRPGMVILVNAAPRQSLVPTSPVFKEYALRLCRRLAEHYKDKPACDRLAHGATNTAGTTATTTPTTPLPRSARGAEAKYGTIDALNEAWGTAFWSQHVNSFPTNGCCCHVTWAATPWSTRRSSWITSGSATTCCSTSTKPNARRHRADLPRQAVHHELHGLHRPVRQELRAKWADEVDFCVQRSLLP